MTAYAQVTSATSAIAEETTSELVGLVQLLITRIPLYIAAFILVILAIIVAKIGRKIVENKLSESGIDEEHQELMILGGRMTYATILTLGITIALKIAGIDLTTIIAAVAFGIGFALKDLIMNFLAGVFILVSKHFTLGDFISISGTIGKIVEIQSRTTVLQAIDGTKVIVPNADLFKKKVTSFTSNPFRRIEVIVGVDYRTNLENTVKVCMKALKETKGVLNAPKPAVLVSKFGESSIELKVRAWVESRGGWLKVKSDLVLEIKKQFDAYGITIPWPIRTVAYDKDQEKVEKIMEEEQAKEELQGPAEALAQEMDPGMNVQVTKEVPVTPAPQEAQTQTPPEEDQPLRPLGDK